MFQGLTIGVTVPAFNEERFIERTLRSLPGWVDRVVVVDDDSRDATATLAVATGDPRVELLRHDRNRGVGRAILSGYQRLHDLGIDVAVVMAGDGQMDPDDLPGLLAPIIEGRADYVKGNRFLHPDLWRTMPRWRLAGNFALSHMTRLTSGYRNVMDSQCGYTALRLALLQRMELERIYPRYGFPNDLLAHLHTAGARVVNVCVRPVYEDEGTGIRPLPAVFSLSWVLLRSFSLRLQRERRTPHPAGQAR